MGFITNGAADWPEGAVSPPDFPLHKLKSLDQAKVNTELQELLTAEIRADVQVRNPAASHIRQPHTIDFTDFLLMLPHSHFSWVRSRRL